MTYISFHISFDEIFNRASGTIVVKVKEGGENDTSKNVTYLKD
ncbi:MAG: hypothetical protein WCF23_10430 [Candidatus Nitrosopolaris sp.]